MVLAVHKGRKEHEEPMVKLVLLALKVSLEKKVNKDLLEAQPVSQDL